MATVRISDKLISEVVGNIGNLYRRFIEDIEKQKPDIGDDLYTLVYGAHQLTMERLPVCFFNKSDRLDVSTVGERKFMVSFKMSSVRLLGRSHPENEHVETSDYGNKLVIHRTPQTDEMVNVVLSWREQIDITIKKREAAQGAIRSLLKSFASLPPAIKAFPPIVDLLPADTRKKIEVPQHRLSSVQMELNPALKQLATDIALDKLINR